MSVNTSQKSDNNNKVLFTKFYRTNKFIGYVQVLFSFRFTNQREVIDNFRAQFIKF